MKYLSYGVMVYMLLALIWWTVLLSRNNELLFHKNLEVQNISQNNITSLSVGEKIIYDTLKGDFINKKYMILGEGLVFGISLIIGLWMIQKAYNKEIENTQKQKNFLLSITHELKTPITSISLISDTLMKRKLNPETQSQMLKSINEENKRLEVLVSNLLMTARLENNYVFNYDKNSVVELLDNFHKTLAITHPDVNIEIKYIGDIPDIACDKESIISVFSNIIENSIKYSDYPADIKIEVKKQSDVLEINFCDKGYGISDGEKAKVLQQFYRTGNEDTRKTKGTGLGLYIVKKILDGHNGNINIKDNKPKGTIISITLPISQNV